MSADGENTKEVAEDSGTEEEDSPPCCSPAAYRRCCCSWNIYWKATVWLAIVLIYLLFGGLIFTAAERPNELREIQQATLARDAARESLRIALVNMTSCNDTFCMDVIDSLLDNITELAEVFQELPSERNPIWQFGPAVYFAATVVTTIGYGVLAPSTSGGQVLFVFYAIFGIPIALTFLSVLGEILAKFIDEPLDRIIKRRKAKGKESNPAVIRLFVVITVIVLGLIFMIFIPAVIFTAIEPWSYGEAVYFCFVTLTTVGFGDFVPAQELSTANLSTSLRGLYTIILSVWTWLGLAFVALLITEIQNLSLGKLILKWVRRYKHKKSTRLKQETVKLHEAQSPAAHGENAPN